MSFLLSLGFFLTIMITFCVKTARSLSKDCSTQKQENDDDDDDLITQHFLNRPNLNEPIESIKHPDMVEESVVAITSLSSLPTIATTSVETDAGVVIVKKDPGGIGFLDEVGGSVDGLMSCTESLGFESSDERTVDDEAENISDWEPFPSSRKISGRTVVSAEVRKFPPPLSSLNHDGKPNFFLRPVRKDGRLELTEVKIDRPEILCASRQDGRLRLHLIKEFDQVHEEQAEEEEEDEVEEENIFEEEEEEERDEKWLFPTTNGGGDGFRRCHEAVTRRHHHHHDIHAWRQHCVTIG